MPQAQSSIASSIPRRGETVELTIEDWGDKGRGIARLGRMVVLTDRGLPGDRVRARITARKRNLLHAALEEIVTPGPGRIDPLCRHFGLCGGCRLLDLQYERQLEGKVRHLAEQLRRIGGLDRIPDIDIVPCEPPFRYRNKMEFSFGGFDGTLALGLHPRENFRDAFDLSECWLTDARVADIVGAVRGFFADGSVAPYHPVHHTGFLRFVVTRLGLRTGDVLVNLVTAAGEWDRSDDFAQCLRQRCPYVTTALWTVNDRRANIATGSLRQVFFGPGRLTEQLGGFTFEIAPGGFFQTNTLQAERLFDRVMTYADPNGGTALDLYAGAGVISLLLSRRADRVIGVESHADSVAAAERNAALNDVTNCRFLCGDVLEYLKADSSAMSPFDLIVVDPPRAGLHPKVARALTRMTPSPRRLVYVSCNTAALARDFVLLAEAFSLERLAAVDMFPHTPHIEAVALLTPRVSG